MTKTKKTILCYSDYYYPGNKAGGPIKTLLNMRKELATEYNFIVATRFNDISSKEKYPTPHNTITDVGMGPTFYTSPFNLAFTAFRTISKHEKIDTVYFNSFFSVFGTIIPLVMLRILDRRLQILVAPRGEFSPGALKIKYFKKFLYITIFRILKFEGSLFWHASNLHEKKFILDVFPDASDRIFIASDSVNIDGHEGDGLTIPDGNGRKEHCKIIFISRISPIKNLEFILQILCDIKDEVSFHIYGPIEDQEYWSECLKLNANLPGNVKFEYRGPLAADQVITTFSDYDVFVFPTKGENFGHVVLESLQAGTPVLVSDQTPWQANDSGSLITIKLNHKMEWLDALRMLIQEGSEEKKVRREAAVTFANDFIQRDRALKKSLRMFQKLEGRKIV